MLPAVGFFAWLFGLVTTAFTSLTVWLMGKMLYEKALRYALITAFLIAAAALFLSVSLSIKAAVLAVQIYMPSPYSQFTYFLPGNINTIFATIVTIRVARSLYRWTVTTMSAYAPTQYGGSRWAM